ncbi:SDR family NAD(P)-dependent oxidoreductase [Haloarcula amylovorans]|uniref:SDR family NAD(P)-dependent oxidoreductase n=1 Tax=Haloarcula amylovorans TaxID=2562280 RepID=UPI0010761793|nr:SDR family oxidoreductase [Halomicroarcula amylolytica]
MNDATVVVTGASRGIGRAVARAIAAAGGHAVVCARNADELAAVADEIDADEGKMTAVRADVRDEFDVERLVERAARVGGEIDGVVANAAIYHGDAGETPLPEESYAAFDDHLRTNARGVFATIRESVPHLASDARVVVPTGAVARRGLPGYGSYAVSKAAAEAVARGFASDLDATVGALDPGQVATDLSGDGGRDPTDVAEMILWALTDAPESALDGAVIDWTGYRDATR